MKTLHKYLYTEYKHWSDQALKDSLLPLKSKVCSESRAHAFKDTTQP